MKWLFIGLFCIITAKYSYQISTPESSSYVAGVVEFAQENVTNVDELLTSNTKRFVEIIKSEDTKNVDILVFPEAVLNKIETAVSVPKPEQKIVACDNKEYVGLLNDISCAVKATAKYAVINIYMKTDCKEEAAATNDTRPCSKPDKNINIYNTNVVFDRSGAIIAIYRKVNLYDEEGARSPFTDDQVTFDTDFGEKFGIFTCFDILFRSPALDLVRKNVKNFIFPSMWFSELPFLTANQVQQSWAIANEVNLLAAGANRPDQGISGSGIYSGTIGALTSLMSEIKTTRILTATVPKKPGAERPPQTSAQPEKQTRDLPKVESIIELKLWQQDLTKFAVKVLDFNQNTLQTGELCHKQQCCKYEVEVIDRKQPKDAPSYYYAVVAFKGQRTFAGAKNFYGGITACGLIACTAANDQSTCGKRFGRNDPAPVERYEIQIAKFVTNYNDISPSSYTVGPSTLSTAVMPLPPSDFQYKSRTYSKENVNYKEVTIELARAKPDLLTFGVFGRDFGLDAVGSASKTVTGFTLVTLSVIWFIIYQ